MTVRVQRAEEEQCVPVGGGARPRVNSTPWSRANRPSKKAWTVTEGLKIKFLKKDAVQNAGPNTDQILNERKLY